MSLNQAVLWIIMGANIGTTITGQLIALDVRCFSTAEVPHYRCCTGGFVRTKLLLSALLPGWVLSSSV